MKYIDRLSMLNQSFLQRLGHRREHSFSDDVEKSLCDIQYYRNIAVELNNISVDFYSRGKYTTAMEFCCVASNVLMICSHSDHQSMTNVLDGDCREALSSKIEHAREQLQTMDLRDTARISPLGCKDGFLCVLNGIWLDLNSSSSLYDDYAAVWYNIALIYMRTGSFECAKQVLEFVVSIASTLESCDLNCVKLFLAASNNLGWIHQTQRNCQHAVDMFTKSLIHAYDKNAILYEETRFLVATILYNVGNIEVTKQNYEEALELLNASLDIMMKAVGENHPDAACILLKIGKIQFELGETSDSTKSFLDVIRIQRMAFGNDHYLVAEPLYRLGMIFESLGEYENALNAYEQTAQIELLTLGPNHSDLAKTLYGIGCMQYEQGNIDLALQAHKKAMGIINANSGIQSVFAASILVEMGKNYRENGMIKESQKALLSSKNILLQLHPKNRGATADILIGLVDCYLAHPSAAATA